MSVALWERSSKISLTTIERIVEYKEGKKTRFMTAVLKKE
jgi:hypothetical protein